MSSLPKRQKLRLKNRGGAPKGNRNTFKTGRHVAEVRALRTKARLIVRQARQAIALALGATAPREI